MARQRQLGNRPPDWRRAILQDLDDLIDELAEQTTDWFRQRPAHIQATYGQEWATNGIVQIPALLALLQRLHCPQVNVLEDELSNGFTMMGTLTPGLGWPAREDSHYQNPITTDQFRPLNRDHALRCLQRPPDQHWETMLNEILADVDLGRMTGPYSQPDWWPRQAVPTPGRPLQPLPDTEPFIAPAFAIHQIGSDGAAKVRRGEDWRRSHHNQTISATDAPYHHTVQHYVQLARLQAAPDPAADSGRDPVTGAPLQAATDSGREPTSRGAATRAPHLWGHDHEGAYRQLPLKVPQQAYVLMMTPRGPTLWRHNVLLFGAVASVWAYNRFGDILRALTRGYLFATAIHYVDDYGAVEQTTQSASSFEAFSDFNLKLGLRMKPSKAQPPAFSHKIQGTIITFDGHFATLSIAPTRRTHLLESINKAIDHNRLTPAEAATLAGKLNFVSSSLFGRMGRSAVKAIYGRQHSPSPNDKLTFALRASMETIRHILLHTPPKQIPMSLQPPPTPPVIYTDAFFEMGDRRFRPGDIDIPEEWDPAKTPHLHNGWGAIFFPQDPSLPQAFTLHGEIPSALLHHYCQRKAFIYFLEAWALIITTITFQSMLRTQRHPHGHYIAFIDNEAAKFALIKGYGRDPAINNMLGLFWAAHAEAGIDPWVERVSTKANPADAISRGDFSQATARSWRHLPINWDKTFHTFINCAADIGFAHRTAPALLRQDLSCQVRDLLKSTVARVPSGNTRPSGPNDR